MRFCALYYIFELTDFNRMSSKEESVRDKLGPTISYLQKLGPDYLSQIFDSARWVFSLDQDMAFDVSALIFR